MAAIPCVSSEEAELESPPHGPVKLPSASLHQQEVGDLCIGSLGYADDTHPLRQEGKCMPPVT